MSDVLDSPREGGGNPEGHKKDGVPAPLRTASLAESAASGKAGATALSDWSDSDDGPMDDSGEVDRAGHDDGVVVHGVPAYLQDQWRQEHDLSSDWYPTRAEMYGLQEQALLRWLPAVVDWEEWQPRPYKPLRSRRGKIKYVGPPLRLALRLTDVLHVEFAASADFRFAKVAKRINTPTGLRAAEIRELSGKGLSAPDYTPTFLWRMLPSVPSPASALLPTLARGYSPGPNSPGRSARAAALAAKLASHKRQVAGIFVDLAPPGDTAGNASEGAPPKWRRKVFLVASVENADAATAATSAWRAIHGEKPCQASGKTGSSTMAGAAGSATDVSSEPFESPPDRESEEAKGEDVSFVQADQDGSGSIDFESFAAMSCHRGMSTSKLRRVFEGLDEDGSGTIGNPHA
jgi:hypothetical protein